MLEPQAWLTHKHISFPKLIIKRGHSCLRTRVSLSTRTMGPIILQEARASRGHCGSTSPGGSAGQGKARRLVSFVCELGSCYPGARDDLGGARHDLERYEDL